MTAAAKFCEIFGRKTGRSEACGKIVEHSFDIQKSTKTDRSVGWHKSVARLQVAAHHPITRELHNSLA